MQKQRKLVCCLSFLLFVTAASWCLFCFCVKTYKENQQPQLVCGEPVYDFGEVTADSNPVHRFSLHVKGSGAVSILKVSPGCNSCVEVVDFTKEPITQEKPGEVVLKLLTSGQTGVIQKSAVLKSDDPVNPYFVLTLQADVRAHIGGDVDSGKTVFPQGEPTLAPLLDE